MRSFLLNLCSAVSVFFLFFLNKFNSIFSSIYLLKSNETSRYCSNVNSSSFSGVKSEKLICKKKETKIKQKTFNKKETITYRRGGRRGGGPLEVGWASTITQKTDQNLSNVDRPVHVPMNFGATLFVFTDQQAPAILLFTVFLRCFGNSAFSSSFGFFIVEAWQVEHILEVLNSLTNTTGVMVFK